MAECLAQRRSTLAVDVGGLTTKRFINERTDDSDHKQYWKCYKQCHPASRRATELRRNCRIERVDRRQIARLLNFLLMVLSFEKRVDFRCDLEVELERR